MMGTNRYSIRDLVDEIQFFNRDLINLVEHVDARNINAKEGED
jgi:thymidine kinase